MSSERNIESSRVGNDSLLVPHLNLLRVCEKQLPEPASTRPAPAIDWLPGLSIVKENGCFSDIAAGRMQIDVSGSASLWIDGQKTFSYGPGKDSQSFQWSGEQLTAINYADNSSLRYNDQLRQWQWYDADSPRLVNGKPVLSGDHLATFKDGAFERSVAIKGPVTLTGLYDQYKAFKADAEKATAYLSSDEYEVLLRMEQQREKETTYAYFCSKGHPTCGIGFNLDRSDARAKLEAMGVNYDKMRASASRSFSGEKPLLTEDQIRTLFKSDISQSVVDAQSLYPNFSRMPKEAQRVVVDLVFNMGKDKVGEFDTFNGLINRGDFRAAARALRATRYYEQVGTRGVANVASLEEAARSGSSSVQL